MVKISTLKGVMPTKIFQQYQIDRKKVSFENAMTFVPKQEIHDIMRRAHATGELTAQLFEKALIRMIHHKSFDRAQIMLQFWKEELQLEVSPIHAQMALNLAVQTKHWMDALHWWKAIQESGEVTVTTELYVAVLKALRQSGDWKNSLAILAEMKSDGVSRSTNAYHAALLSLRENAPWTIALETVTRMFHSEIGEKLPEKFVDATTSIADELNFGKIGMQSSELTDSNYEINAHLSTEAVHIIKRAVSARSGALNLGHSGLDGWRTKSFQYNAWKLASKIYYSSQPSQRTTSLQNACIEVAARTGHWLHALQLLKENIDTIGGVRYHRSLTPETLLVLLPCLREHPEQLSALLEVALQQNLSIPSLFLEALFLCIMNTKGYSGHTDRTNELVELFMRLRSISLKNTLSCIGYHTLCEAMCDALLKSTNPSTAFRVGRFLKPLLEAGVPLLSDNLCSYGSEHTIDVVEGRVAVVDGTTGAILKANRLGEFFDNVALPYCVLRERVDFSRTLKRTTSQFRLLKSAQEFIKSVRKSNLGKRLICLTLLSQLRAQVQLSQVSPKVEISTQKLHAHQSKKLESNVPRVLSSLWDKREITVRDDNSILENEFAIQKWIHCNTHKERYIRLKALRIFAAALALQALNFDADVHLLTRSQQNATLFEELKKVIAVTIGKHRKLPKLLYANTEKDIATFFDLNPGNFRFRENGGNTSKCDKSCRVMRKEILHLNV